MIGVTAGEMQAVTLCRTFQSVASRSTSDQTDRRFSRPVLLNDIYIYQLFIRYYDNCMISLFVIAIKNTLLLLLLLLQRDDSQGSVFVLS